MNPGWTGGKSLGRATRLAGVAIPFVGMVLVFLLSVRLYAERRLTATILAEIARSTHGFLRGVELPALRMLPEGQTGAIDLRDLCETNRPLLVYFSGEHAVQPAGP